MADSRRTTARRKPELAALGRGWERWCLGQPASRCEDDNELAGWLYAAAAKALGHYAPHGEEVTGYRFDREDLERARQNLRLAPRVLGMLGADVLPDWLGRTLEITGVSTRLRRWPDGHPR